MPIDVIIEADGAIRVSHHRRVEDVDRDGVLQADGLIIGALDGFLDALHGPVAILL